MGPKKLVLFVEGPQESDGEAARRLVNKVINELQAHAIVSVAERTWRTQSVGKLLKRPAKDTEQNLIRWLKDAAKQAHAVLLLLDGDEPADPIQPSGPFCASRTARFLAKLAGQAGAGIGFSFAAVFACRECETWLLAGAESLRGKPLVQGRAGVPHDAQLPERVSDEQPRSPKDWFKQHLPGGYRETRDQALLAKLVDIRAIRKANVRSFRRFEHAIDEIVEALHTGDHVSTPA